MRRQRIIDRGGKPLNDSQASHISEKEVVGFTDDKFDLIIDTVKFQDLKEQAQFVMNSIMHAIQYQEIH